MIDPTKHHTEYVNRDLTRVFKGKELIGQARRGLDGKWYRELPEEQFRTAATHKVIIAHEAIVEARRVLNG